MSASAEIAGNVVSVLDGDTIDVLVDRKPARICRAEIDAPEKRKPVGPVRAGRWPAWWPANW